MIPSLSAINSGVWVWGAFAQKRVVKLVDTYIHAFLNEHFSKIQNGRHFHGKNKANKEKIPSFLQ